MRNKKADGDDTPDYFSVGWMMLISLCITLYLNWPTVNSRFWFTFKEDWFHNACANTFATILLMMTIIDFCTRYLDAKILWEKHFWKRMLTQVFLGWIIPVLFCYLFAWACFYFLNLNIRSTRYIRDMSSLIVMISFMINLLHVVYYYIYKSTTWINSEPEGPKNVLPDYLLIPDGKGEKKLLKENISYIFIEKGTTYIQHHEGKRDVCFIALDHLFKNLDPASFFRASRSYIVSRKSVEGYEKQPDRSLLLDMLPRTEGPLFVSRLKASRFTAWFKSFP